MCKVCVCMCQWASVFMFPVVAFQVTLLHRGEHSFLLKSPVRSEALSTQTESSWQPQLLDSAMWQPKPRCSMVAGTMTGRPTAAISYSLTTPSKWYSVLWRFSDSLHNMVFVVQCGDDYNQYLSFLISIHSERSIMFPLLPWNMLRHFEEGLLDYVAAWKNLNHSYLRSWFFNTFTSSHPHAHWL